MATTKKIIVSKTDDAVTVAEKFIDAEAATVTISIPKGAAFARAVSVFKLLKRQADILKKDLIIESVDEEIVALAKKAGLVAVNPFFSQSSKAVFKKFSDIVVRAKEAAGEDQPKAVPVVVAEPEPAEEPIPEKIVTKASKPVASVRRKLRRFFSFRLSFDFAELFRKRNIIIAGIVAALALCTYVGAAVLPKATVNLKMKKEPWTYTGAVFVDKSISSIDAAEPRIPGQLFVQKSNATLQAVATGKKAIERRATGSIIVYNALSSKPQPLVANTRFSTPDNKIFRLVSSITVPGANVEDGKIVPSSVSASIIADKPGAEYNNVGPVAKLTIPGFANTPKYAAFYGEIKVPTTGGFVGELKVATEADIKAAKAEANKNIENAVRTLMTTQMPNNFKVLDGASKFMITKQTVNQEADASGKFSVFTEGQLALMAFQEKDMLAMAVSRVQKEKGNEYQIRDVSLTYKSVQAADPLSGRMSVAIEYVAELSRSVDEPALLTKMQGQPQAGLQAIVNALPGVDTAELKLWPFWVKTIPSKLSRITLKVE